VTPFRRGGIPGSPNPLTQILDRATAIFGRSKVFGADRLARPLVKNEKHRRIKNRLASVPKRRDDRFDASVYAPSLPGRRRPMETRRRFRARELTAEAGLVVRAGAFAETGREKASYLAHQAIRREETAGSGLHCVAEANSRDLTLGSARDLRSGICGRLFFVNAGFLCFLVGIWGLGRGDGSSRKGGRPQAAFWVQRSPNLLTEFLLSMARRRPAWRARADCRKREDLQQAVATRVLRLVRRRGAQHRIAAGGL